MIRVNGTFSYTTLQEPQRDPATGFISATGTTQWILGSRCQIEKSIPAKHCIGTDGQEYLYTYSVYIPRCFKGDLLPGTQVKLVTEDGDVYMFTIQGVDSNRKYIEVWG